MNSTTIFSGNGNELTAWKYSPSTSNQLLIVNGSGASRVANSLMEMNVLVNGTIVDTMKIWANPEYQHMAYVGLAIPLNLTPNSPCTIQLVAANESTYLDFNDYYNLTIVE